jgi:hypothetical protein
MRLPQEEEELGFKGNNKRDVRVSEAENRSMINGRQDAQIAEARSLYSG